MKLFQLDPGDPANQNIWAIYSGFQPNKDFVFGSGGTVQNSEVEEAQGGGKKQELVVGVQEGGEGEE